MVRSVTVLPCIIQCLSSSRQLHWLSLVDHVRWNDDWSHRLGLLYVLHFRFSPGAHILYRFGPSGPKYCFQPDSILHRGVWARCELRPNVFRPLHCIIFLRNFGRCEYCSQSIAHYAGRLSKCRDLCQPTEPYSLSTCLKAKSTLLRPCLSFSRSDPSSQRSSA